VGYDPLNEPYPGNNLKDLSLNKPGKADKELLAPMYTKIFEGYQANNVNNTMWFEPVQVPDQIPAGGAGGLQFPVGFEKPPGGEIGSNKHVLNDHYYCCVLINGVCKVNGEPDAAHAAACDTWAE
jgi:hypothetical protein